MRFLRPFVAVTLSAAVAVAVPAGEKETEFKGIGNEKIVIHMADPTTAGTFDGTWMYVNRDVQFGMWIRTRNGVPQVKFQYQSLASTEAFETDWDGKATYYLGGAPVTFEFKPGACTADQITGSWSWVVKGGNSGRSETANIVLYRTYDGRTLLMDYQDYEKKLTQGDHARIVKAPTVWNWIKISKRELLWDEFPF
jgi:hypothetical protein